MSTPIPSSAGEGKYVGNQTSTPSPVVQKQDIVGLVRELQELHAAYPNAKWYERSHVFLSFNIKCRESFPSIAQALLDREEKLKIAVEELEKIRAKANVGHAHPEMTDIEVLADEALSRIRSFPVE